MAGRCCSPASGSDGSSTPARKGRSVTGFDVSARRNLVAGVRPPDKSPRRDHPAAVPPPPDELRMMLELRNPTIRPRCASSTRSTPMRSAASAPRGVRGDESHRRALPAAGDERQPLHGGDRRVAGRARYRRARRHRFAHRHRRHWPGRADLDVAVTHGTLSVRSTRRRPVANARCRMARPSSWRARR